MNWHYNKAFDISNEIELINHWENNLVKIEQIEKYSGERPKGFIFTYFIPSPIDSPKVNTMPANISDNPPQIGYKHKIYVCLPINYPAVKSVEMSRPGSDSIYIESRSQLWHPRFYLRQQSWGCIMVNGEIDRIAMNIFQQLLWEPSHIWKLSGEHETTNNTLASQWGKRHGKNDVHQFMLNLMNEKWGGATLPENLDKD